VTLAHLHRPLDEVEDFWMFVLKGHAEDLGEVTRCQPHQFDAIQGEDGLQVGQRAFTFHRGDDERFGLNPFHKARKRRGVWEATQMNHPMPIAFQPQQRLHVLGGRNGDGHGRCPEGQGPSHIGDRTRIRAICPGIRLDPDHRRYPCAPGGADEMGNLVPV
jgi:hypothetical protein